jgi:DNA-binding response OmpR family regulator
VSAGWYEDGVSDQSILVVDDDDDMRGLVRRLLERGGYTVREAEDGRAALRELFAAPPDLVLLDVMMPGLDGWTTLERIREVSEVPVIMLTSRDTELERVRGLSRGADDYLSKPFGRQELVARVQAMLRRAGGGAQETPEAYADAYLEIDFKHHLVRAEERDVSLTPLEFKLLAVFVRHPNQVLSGDQLLELVWGDAYGVSRDQVKLYVGYLRRKLGPEGTNTVPIETVRGFGYRYRRT